MDLSELIKDLKPNIITPHMEEVMKANPAARGNVIARCIIRGMARQKGSIDPIDIMHAGAVQTVRFLDVEPLCEGPWAMYSLILLNVSYGEQSTIIEALYPEKKQLMAKTFAALFSHDAPNAPKRQQDDVLMAVENANAGIAMILAKLEDSGSGLHADTVGKQRTAMQELAESMKRRDQFRKGYEKSQQKYKKGDQ
jgi:hypothetical protein